LLPAVLNFELIEAMPSRIEDEPEQQQQQQQLQLEDEDNRNMMDATIPEVGFQEL
jgi:hypothetical protein